MGDLASIVPSVFLIAACVPGQQESTGSAQSMPDVALFVLAKHGFTVDAGAQYPGKHASVMAATIAATIGPGILTSCESPQCNRPSTQKSRSRVEKLIEAATRQTLEISKYTV